jgi:membrane-associated phospholipid phosphatase
LPNNCNRNLLIVTGGLAVLAVAIFISAHWLPLFPGDLYLTRLFQSFHNESSVSVMEWVSYFTDSWRAALLIVAGVIVVWWRLGKLEATLVVAAGLSSLLKFVLKAVVERPRPTPDLIRVLVLEQGNGFPSGHALFAAVFFGLLAYFAFTRLRRRGPWRLIPWCFLVLILLVGASRVYLGVHWPSDVLGGYLVGTVILGILIWFDRVYQRENPTS